MPLRNLPILRCVLSLVLGLVLGGCGSVPFKVTAMHFQDVEPRQRTFQIVNQPPARPDSDPTSGRLADYVRTALVNRGFREAPPGGQAGMIIAITFDQETPRTEIRTQTENIYQWQPERTVLKAKQTKLPGGFVVNEPVPTRVPAHSEAVGSRTVSYKVKVFPKRLRIVGRDVADPSAPGTGRSLWSVEVRNEDAVDDLKRFTLLMVAAAMDYLGADFSGEKTVSVSRNDARAKVILRPPARSEPAAR